MKFNIQEDNGILKYATEEEVKTALDIGDSSSPLLKSDVGGYYLDDTPIPVGTDIFLDLRYKLSPTASFQPRAHRAILLGDTSTRASGIESVAIHGNAQKYKAVSIGGLNSIALADNSTQINGNRAYSKSPYSFVTGYEVASGFYGEAVFGRYSTSIPTADIETDWVNNSPIFRVGVGSDLNNRKDGFVITNTGLIKAPQQTIELTTDPKQLSTKEYVDTKNPLLVSGTNIKTINGNSILGEGNLEIGGDSSPIQLIGSTIADSRTYNVPLQDSNFFGKYAGAEATDASNSNFFGESAGRGSIEASYSNFLGSSSGKGALYASGSNFLGFNAGSSAANASDSNFIGGYAGDGATNSANSNFLGLYAGYYANSASYSNFLGNRAGMYANNVSYSNFFGYNVGSSFTNNSVGTNNIIIGTNISLPNAATNSINLGGVLYGTGTNNNTTSDDPSITPSSNGKIGIGVVTPTETFEVNGTAGYTVSTPITKPTQFASKEYVDSNSGGATSLQELTSTENGNYSNNILYITGTENEYTQPDRKSLQLYYHPLTSAGYISNSFGKGQGPKSFVELGNSKIELRGGSARFTLTSSGGDKATFSGTVSGEDGVNSTDFVTKGQLDAVRQSASIHDSGTFVANTIGDVTTFTPTIAGIPTDNFEMNIKKVDGVTHGIKYIVKKAGIHFVNYQSLRTAGHEQVIINTTKAVDDEVILDAIYYNDGSEATQMTFKHTDGKLYVLKIMILSGGAEGFWSVEKW